LKYILNESLDDVREREREKHSRWK
jgi:hypothetical protein